MFRATKSLGIGWLEVSNLIMYKLRAEELLSELSLSQRSLVTAPVTLAFSPAPSRRLRWFNSRISLQFFRTRILNTSTMMGTFSSAWKQSCKHCFTRLSCFRFTLENHYCNWSEKPSIMALRKMPLLCPDNILQVVSTSKRVFAINWAYLYIMYMSES